MAPARFEVGSGNGHYTNTPKDLFHLDYFECLDMIVACIHNRFNQPGYGVLKNLELQGMNTMMQNMIMF